MRVKWQVVFYTDEDGNEPVKDFIVSQDYATRARIIHVLDLLHQFNVQLGPPYAKKIGKSGIRELRIKHATNIYRIFFFAHTGRKLVLLHAIQKKTDKTPESDVRLATARMNEHLSRG